MELTAKGSSLSPNSSLEVEHTAKWCCNIRSNHTASQTTQMTKGISKRIDRYLAISKSNSEIGVRAGEGTMLVRKKRLKEETDFKGLITCNIEAERNALPQS